MCSKQNWNTEMKKSNIWYEKYQPKDLEEFIFANESDEKLFNSFADNKDIPNLLISGIQGTGKSSMVAILINELGINKFDTKIINGSSKTGVDNIRNSVEGFAKTLGTGKFKVVVFEEAEELSLQAQKALRMIIDNAPETVKWIFTSNYPDKIIPALHSRLQHVHITQLDYESIVERVLEIMVSESVEFTKEEDIYTHIDAYTPDLRKIITSIQQHSMSGTLQPLTERSAGSNGFDEWEQLWKDVPDKDDVMHLIPQLDLSSVDKYYRVMYESITGVSKELNEDAIVTIADHLYKSNFVADQEINLMACIILMYSSD